MQVKGWEVNITPGEFFSEFEASKNGSDVSGTLKWDGCINVKMDLHFCKLDEIKEFNEMLLELYSLASDAILTWSPC